MHESITGKLQTAGDGKAANEVSTAGDVKAAYDVKSPGEVKAREVEGTR